MNCCSKFSWRLGWICCHVAGNARKCTTWGPCVSAAIYRTWLAGTTTTYNKAESLHRRISCNQTMASFGVRGMGQPLGIRICCCRVCTCINFGFVLSRIGLLKLMQLGLAMLCEGLLIRYGVPYADSIGQALTSFLATTGHCFTTTGILLLCYAFSDKSCSLIRQSLFVG